MSAHESGAYTGEISASMYSSMGITHCIIGHSERRKYHHEKDSLIHEKLQKLLAEEIVPIVCVGETLEEREAGITRNVILDQLKGVFEGISFNDPIVIAYEPVWAIGTGKTASPEQAQEIHAIIRQWVKAHVSPAAAENVPILYGGSMKPENIAELISQPDIDGGLIGGASLDAKSLSPWSRQLLKCNLERQTIDKTCCSIDSGSMFYKEVSNYVRRSIYQR